MKGITFVLTLILLGAVILGLLLGGGEILHPQKTQAEARLITAQADAEIRRTAIELDYQERKHQEELQHLKNQHAQELSWSARRAEIETALLDWGGRAAIVAVAIALAIVAIGVACYIKDRSKVREALYQAQEAQARATEAANRAREAEARATELERRLDWEAQRSRIVQFPTSQPTDERSFKQASTPLSEQEAA